MDTKFRELREEVYKVISSRCVGCINDHPSQKYHNYCLSDCNEDFDIILAIAKANINGRSNDQTIQTQEQQHNI